MAVDEMEIVPKQMDFPGEDVLCVPVVRVD